MTPRLKPTERWGEYVVLGFLWLVIVMSGVGIWYLVHTTEGLR